MDATLQDTPPDSQAPIDAVRAVARLARVLERSTDELSLAHYRVLSAIDAGEARASRLASRLALGKPAVSAAVEALRQKGLVVRVVVESDQRAASLSLTPAGSDLLARVESEMTCRLSALCALTPDPQAVSQALVALGEAIEESRR